MEIMRKRSYHLSDSNVYDGTGDVHKRHMELNLMHSTTSNGQKRMCNGVSSFLLQVDQTSGCTGISVGDSVAMETMHATSCHPHIPAESMQSSCYVMTAGGDATSTVLSQRLENQKRKVCQRCLSGESGHITHILS